MTQIKATSPVTRETDTPYRKRNLIVTLHPGYMTLRPKGTQQTFAIDYRAVYEAAMKLAARQGREG